MVTDDRDQQVTPPRPLGYTVTAADIYGELRQLSGQLSTAITQQEISRQQIQDHEARLRSLEAWRYALPVSAVSAIIAAVAAVISAFAG
jgi:hypothetical protein